MIPGISFWSIASRTRGQPLTIADALEQAKQAGFEALELVIDETGELNTASSEADCLAIRRTIDRSGIHVSSLASALSWKHCPTDPRPQVRRHALALQKAALLRARWLGCDALLFVPGATVIPWDPSFGPVNYRDALRWARTAVAQLAKLGEKHDVQVCLENVHNGFLYSPAELADFIDSFQSEAVKAYLDVGNLIGIHQDPPGWIDALGRRITRVHFKDHHRRDARPCDLGAGDVPWARTIAALRKIRYRGPVVAEMTPPAEGLLERTRAAMTTILADAGSRR